jgi:thiol-disulfide isomerase/thioredoxin
MSGAWAQTTQSKTLANAAAPAVIAVKFYADWCGSCKVITPVFHELQAKFDTQPVLYIVLDHTREFNRQQSKYLATSLGLDKIWAKNGGKTGFILLINGKTQEIITTLTKKHDLKQMGAALQAAVNKITS